MAKNLEQLKREANLPAQVLHEEVRSERAMVAIESSRAVQEVQAQFIIAKRFPRDTTSALVRILEACKRPRLAESALYSYPRGGTTVTGPSIRLAEVLAQNWGNISFGIRELERLPGESIAEAYCTDMETLSMQTKTFSVPHVRWSRDKGAENLHDPRDIYETVANHGARRLRACILGIIPPDIQDEAIAQVRKTLAKAGGDKPLGDRVRAMVVAFREFGVSQAMIEDRLGHNVDATSEEELIQLRAIYHSLKDGMAGRDEYFDLQAKGPRAQKKQAAVEDKKQPEEPSPAAAQATHTKAEKPAPQSGRPNVTLEGLLADLAKAKDADDVAVIQDLSREIPADEAKIVKRKALSRMAAFISDAVPTLE